MKLNRFALLFSALLVFSGCSSESEDAGAAAEADVNPLLAYVPADTAYVFADLEAVPKDITDAYVTRFQPVMDIVSKHVSKFQTDYAAGGYEENEMAKLAMAVLDEFGGDLSAENLEKFGMDLQAHYAIYGMGVFPTMRFELNDAQKLRDAIARIGEKMGSQIPVKTFNGIDYWRVTDEGDGGPMGMYIAILEEQLVISAFPVSAEASLLASFLGQELPANSLATTNGLADINREKGYTAYGSGVLDLQKLSDEILNEGSSTRAYLGPEIASKIETFDAVCVAEARAMIAKAPRMTVGVTELTTDTISTRYDLEMNSILAGGLAMLVTDTPVAEEGDFLLSASLAIQVGRLRSFVLERANNIVATPFQCSHFQDMNHSAEKLVSQMNVPMPPMVNNLNGLRVRMDDFNPAGEPLQGEGLVALHVDKPEMFIGMATMMVPGFEALDLANQSEPVRIPAEMLPIEGVDIFALMGDTAIGAAVGEQHAGDLDAFMSAKSQSDGTFFSISYDMAKQMQIQSAFSDDSSDSHGDHNAYHSEIQKAYADILGRSNASMRFTAEGLSIDSTMTFK